jgi:copper homeostasis protein
VDSLESIKSAIEGGADRLELCSALSEGGLTPTLGLARLAKNISAIPIFAMIRIRGGDFVYELEELGKYSICFFKIQFIW